jgi:hypothetical protein
MYLRSRLFEVIQAVELLLNCEEEEEEEQLLQLAREALREYIPVFDAKRSFRRGLKANRGSHSWLGSVSGDVTSTKSDSRLS